MGDRGLGESLFVLLDLDGETFFVDRDGLYWVKFEARLVPASAERPHGVKYSLTLHDASGRRLVGFDNAHALPRRRLGAGYSVDHYDHEHRGDRTLPYIFRDAPTLIADFWARVESELAKRGGLT